MSGPSSGGAAGALMAAMTERLEAVLVRGPDPLANVVEPDRTRPSGALPALTLADLSSTDRSTKTEAGAEVVVRLTAHERPGRIAAARGLLDAAGAALSEPPPVPGWQLVSLAERGRASAAEASGGSSKAEGPVRATAEWRARLFRTAP